jgi:hypothetical protein
MVGREEGRRPRLFHACGGAEPPESARREHLLQVQQRPRTRTEQLLRLLDTVAWKDAAADVEKGDASCAEVFRPLDEQRRRRIAAFGQRDVEERASAMPSAQPKNVTATSRSSRSALRSSTWSLAANACHVASDRK